MQPIPTPNNICEYTPQSIVIISDYRGKPRNIVVEEDDYFRYNHDDLETISLISLMIKSDIYHLIVKTIKEERATAVYIIVVECFKGHKHQSY